MAKVLQDPHEHPDVILADFQADSPLVTFGREDVVFTYGSKWKQRYYTTDRRRLLRLLGAVGCSEPSVAAVWSSSGACEKSGAGRAGR